MVLKSSWPPLQSLGESLARNNPCSTEPRGMCFLALVGREAGFLAFVFPWVFHDHSCKYCLDTLVWDHGLISLSIEFFICASIMAPHNHSQWQFLYVSFSYFQVESKSFPRWIWGIAYTLNMNLIHIYVTSVPSTFDNYLYFLCIYCYIM